jgi:hypothetical protein
MWMLRHGLQKTTKTSSQNVYLNVTWHFVEVEDSLILSSSQNVYVNVTRDVSEKYQVLKMFVWMLHDISWMEDSLTLPSSQNVCANVTWWFIAEGSTKTSSQNVYVNVAWHS